MFTWALVFTVPLADPSRALREGKGKNEHLRTHTRTQRETTWAPEDFPLSHVCVSHSVSSLSTFTLPLHFSLVCRLFFLSPPVPRIVKHVTLSSFEECPYLPFSMQLSLVVLSVEYGTLVIGYSTVCTVRVQISHKRRTLTSLICYFLLKNLMLLLTESSVLSLLLLLLLIESSFGTLVSARWRLSIQ